MSGYRNHHLKLQFGFFNQRPFSVPRVWRSSFIFRNISEEPLSGFHAKLELSCVVESLRDGGDCADLRKYSGLEVGL